MTEREEKQLLKKYLAGECTPQERAMLESWYLERNLNALPDLGENERLQDLSEIRSALGIEHLSSDHKSKKPLSFTQLSGRWVAAAAVAVVILGAGWFYFTKMDKDATHVVQYANDIAPGKQSATLTLANGKKIVLSSVSNEELGKQAGTNVAKEEGTLAYTVYPPLSALGATADHHTLSTAKGETYRVGLPDGSTVWLNAESSLKYPASFVNRDKRSVILTGEGYFEIAKDKNHPFIVETDKQKVEVLGTHFNINSYADEPSVKTTLLEGSVRVSSGKMKSVLKPDQQAIVTGSKIKIEALNAEDAVAWKDGLFVFDDEPLEDIMRRVSRWYNVEVIYEKGVDRNEPFGGSVSRYDNISKVLQPIESTGFIHFKIEGRRLRVMK